MSFDTEKLTELLNRASMDLVMLSPDNLLEISSLLGITEELGRWFVQFESEWPPKVFNSLKAILRGIIRDEVPERVEALEVAGEALGILQELSGSLPAGTPITSDIPEFLKKAKKFITNDLVSSSLQDEEEANVSLKTASSSPSVTKVEPREIPPHMDEKSLYPGGIRTSSDDIDEGWGADDLALQNKGDTENKDDKEEDTREPFVPERGGDFSSAEEEGVSDSVPDSGSDSRISSAEDIISSSPISSEANNGEDNTVVGDDDAGIEEEGGLGADISTSLAAGSDNQDTASQDTASQDTDSQDNRTLGQDIDNEGKELSPEERGELSPEQIEDLRLQGAREDGIDGENELLSTDDGENMATDESDGTPHLEKSSPPRGWTCKYNYFLDQTLTAEYFKVEFIQALESLQMKLVTVEQKSDTVSAMAETVPHFRTILGGVSLLALDELTWLTADTIGLIDYVSTEQVSHSTKITDILLKALHYIISGLQTLEINKDGKSWRIFPSWEADEMNSLKDSLWEARQGILPSDDGSGNIVAYSSGASFAAKPKKLGEILVEKGLISEGDLGGLIQAQKTARNVRLGEILIQEGLITEEELNEGLERQKNEDKDRKIGEILVSMGRLDHEHLEKALKIQESMKETKLGEFILKKKIGAPEKVAAALREQKQSEGQQQAPGSHTVKVETQKLDGLIDLVGELVITQSLVTSNDSIKILKEQKINKDLAQVSRITSELQRNAMSLRMVQINNTFRKMNRLVRDLAHKFEKDVEFVTSGDDTEIDRNMVESIYDPLIHMIRNALDHGLESPQERKNVGKSPKGQLSLKAYHQGGNVVIELRDDGRGLNVDKVIKKAEEKGFIQPGETLTKIQAHNIVFQPGFSTSDSVTEISGRGVGMDVARKSIELLRGKVDFTSEEGMGSIFTIRLPLTLAIIDGMIVRVGDNRYILPTISINESFRPKPEEYFTVKNQGEMIKVRDNLLPLVRLDQIVNVEGAIRDPSDALVVVVENEGQRRCLLVDEVLGKQEVVIKSLGERLKYVRALAGGTILGDGRVGLILDINGLFEVGEGLFSPPPKMGSDTMGGASSHEDWDM
jgi:chemotaxis protein histidine kinase CheA